MEDFLAAFVSGPDAVARAATLHDLLLPQAVVVRTCGEEPQVLDVDSFVAPRADLLSSGRLSDFREWPTEVAVEVFGDVAQAWVAYAKSWREGEIEHAGTGAKSVQAVRTGAGWRISAVAWDDER